jgi:hypothetical protein
MLDQLTATDILPENLVFFVDRCGSILAMRPRPTLAEASHLADSFSL